jgi:hypothetical protein
MGAQLHRHILVVHHLHPGDIHLHPIGLKLIHLPTRQEAVDRVPKLTLIATHLGRDGLPGGVSHNIVARCSESGPLVPAEDSRPKEDLCDGLELNPPWTRDFLDPLPRGSGDAQVFQQSPKPSGGDRSFSPEGLHLVCILIHLLVLHVTWGRLLFISVVCHAMGLRLLLLLSRRPLS